MDFARPLLPLLVGAALLLHAPGCGRPETAPEFFDRFEKALRATPSHQLSFTGEFVATKDGKEEKFLYSGSCRSRPGVGTRSTFSIDRGRWSPIQGGGGSGRERPSVPGAYLTDFAARSGGLILALEGWTGEPRWTPPPLVVSSLRFGPEDGPVRRHLVYSIQPLDTPPVEVQLWVDPETLAPLGRKASVVIDGVPLRIGESYPDFRTEEIPASDF